MAISLKLRPSLRRWQPPEPPQPPLEVLDAITRWRRRTLPAVQQPTFTPPSFGGFLRGAFGAPLGVVERMAERQQETEAALSKAYQTGTIPSLRTWPTIAAYSMPEIFAPGLGFAGGVAKKGLSAASKKAIEASAKETVAIEKAAAEAGRPTLRPRLGVTPGEMAPGTSVQTGLEGFGKESAQVKMFEEAGRPGAKPVPLIDAEAIKAAEAAKPLPGQVAIEASQVVRVPVDQIKVDPQRFQFKQGVSPVTGATGKLGEVTYNPLLEGATYGWQDKQGVIWIINGHHRLDLAKRSGTKSIGIRIDREVDGVTEQMARSNGALINIAEDQGTAFDVAKFLRNSGMEVKDLTQFGVSPTGRLASRGAAIAQLDESLFNKLAIGQLDEESAVRIGQGLPGDFANQREVAKFVIDGEVTPRELTALIKEAKAAGTIKETRLTLFGETEVEKSLLRDRAKLRAFIEDELAKDRRIFGYVTAKGRPEVLKRGGTQVDVVTGQKLVQQSGTAQAIFEAKANAVGPINDIMSDAAGRIAQGGNVNEIRNQALDQIRAAIVTGESGGAARPGIVGAGAQVSEVTKAAVPKVGKIVPETGIKPTQAKPIITPVETRQALLKGAVEPTVPAGQAVEEKIRGLVKSLFRELGEDQGLSGDTFAQAVRKRIVAELGSDPIVRLYRGVNRETEAAPGKFWTSSYETAASYAGTRGGTGQVYVADLKASQLANAELALPSRGEGSMWVLGEKLQQQSHLLSVGQARAVPLEITPKAPEVPPVGKSVAGGIPPSPSRPPTALGAMPEPTAPRIMDDLQDVAELVETMTHPDFFRKVGNLPTVRSVLKYFNPAAVADDVAAQTVIARAALREEGTNKAIGAFATLEQQGNYQKIWGQLDDAGRITKGSLSGKSLDEVLTYRSKYSMQMTDEQLRWAQQFHDLEAAKADFLARNGIEIKELSFAEGGEYVGRRVVGRIDKATGEIVEAGFVGAGPSRPGAKMAAEKTRRFKDINEALESGFRYLPPDEALFVNIKAAYNRVAEKMASDWALAKIPWRSTEMFNLPKASALVRDALKKTPISASRLTALRRDMPDFAAKIEAALKETDWPTRYNSLQAIRAELKQVIPTAQAKLFWMVETLTKQRKTAEDAVLVMQRALRGESIPVATIKAIEKVVPQLKGKLKAATQTTLDDLIKAGREAAEWPKTLEVPHPGVLLKYRKLLKETTEALAKDPSNAVLAKRVRELKSKEGFTKYRMKLGEPLEISKSPKNILTKDRKVALEEALAVLRGEGYETITTTGHKVTKYRGGMVKELRKQEQVAVQQRKMVAERARAPSFGEATVQAPAFQGKILTGAEAKQTAETLNKAFNAQYGPIDEIITSANKVNAVSRFFVLAGDASVFMIQLIMWPFRFPKQYVLAGKQFAKAMFSEKAQAAYLAANNDVIQRSRNLILTKGGQTEYTEAMRVGGLLSAKRWPGKLLTPFQRGFEAALDTAGVELRKSFDYLATTPQRTAEIEQFINEVRGVTSSARLGVSPQIRAAETLVTLAPRYNRAMAGLFTDVLNGGLRGDQARKAMLATTAGFASIGLAYSLAKGESWEVALDHLNPQSPDFMTWSVAGQRVGPGSKMRSVLVLAGRIAAEPEKTVDHVTRFARGNLSPLLSTGTDIVTGKDFIGRPTRPGTGVGWGEGMLGLSEQVVVENLTPLWIQDMAEGGGGVGQRATRGTVQFFGGRAYQPSNVSSSFEWRWRDDFKEYNAIPTDAIERQVQKLPFSRTQYRMRNPDVDAKLFISGQVSSLENRAAIQEVIQLIQENKINPDTISGIATAKKRADERDKAGLPPTNTYVDQLLRQLDVGVTTPTALSTSEEDFWNSIQRVPLEVR